MLQWAIRKINDLLLGTGSPLPPAARAEEPKSPSQYRRQALPMHQPLPAVEDVLMQLRFIVMETRSLFLSKPSLMAWIKTSFPLGNAQEGEMHCSYPRHPLHHPGACSPAPGTSSRSQPAQHGGAPNPSQHMPTTLHQAAGAHPTTNTSQPQIPIRLPPCLSPPAGPKQPED